MLARSRGAPRLDGLRVGCRALAASLSLVAAVALAGPAAAAPSDQPGGTTAVLDSRALDELQQRAAEVQAELQEQQGEVVAAREALAAAEQAVADAEAVVADAEGELARYQEVVAGYAVRGLPGRRRADAADAPALRRRPGRRPVRDGLPRGRRRARRRGDRGGRGAAPGGPGPAGSARSAALEQARARADEVAARVAELEAAATAVTDELDAALGEVDRQLSAAPAGTGRREQPDGGQLEGLRRRAHRGRGRRRRRPPRC